jgi:hypothetical protein
MARLPTLKRVALSLPFGLGEMEWEPDTTERNAAWKLYVELVTRISVQQLDRRQGLMREALNSLYTIYPTTREVLRDAGPAVGATHDSVGGIAIAVLNIGLRPFMTKWHPALLEWEARRPPERSAAEHERQWEHEPAMRDELETLRGELATYAEALAIIAGVKQQP